MAVINEDSENLSTEPVTDSEAGTDGRTKDRNQDGYTRTYRAGNFEVTFSGIELKSPVELLEKLVKARNDEKLTDDERSQHIERIMKEYME